MVRYITPAGSGSRDGTSWSNAGTLGSLDSFIGAVGPGGEVLLRADMGGYNIGGIDTRTIGHGGASGAPVTVRGADEFGAGMKVEIVGVRADPWLPGLNKGGQEVFLLQSGADHLVFRDLSFKNVGSAAFRIGADISDLTLRDIVADNVQRFLEDQAVASTGTASVDGLTMTHVDVRGFSKSAVHLRYDSRHILIEDVLGDSEGQDGDNFAMGVHLEGTVHDVVIRRTKMLNSHDSVNSYWNGDGFATERGVYDVLFEDTYAAGNTDGGYDLKSSGTHLVRATAEDNKRNFRFWSDDIVVEDSLSLNPHIRGGSGLQSHIWVAAGAHPSVIGTTLSDNDPRTVVLDISDGASSTLSLVDSPIVRAVGSTFARFIVGSQLVIDGVTYGTDANGVVVGTEQKDSLVGTAGADELHGGGGDDLINARGGADVIDGGAGSDMVSYDNSPGGVVINLVAGTGAGSYAEGDRLSGIENLRGSQADDVLRGDSGANLITGERGADTIEGGGGADNLIGGADVDTLDYSGSAGGVAVNLTSGTGSAGDAAGDRVSQFENLVGSGYADQLVGDGADNVISGRSGNDVLYGLAGNDRLIGDAGSDRLVGGLGNDTYVVGDRTDVVVERAGEGFDRVIASRSFALSSSSAIELLVASAANARSHARLDLAGSSAANRIEGNSSANVLDGKGGADTLEGFRGNDTYVMDNARDRVLEVRGGGTDTVSVSVSYKLQPRAEVEVLKAASSHATASLHLTGNEFANLLLGNAGRNHLAGKEGKDQLRGLGGSDTLDGGPGSDVLIGGPGHDTFVFRSPLSAPANIDRITDFRPADDTIALGHAFFPNAGPVGSLDPGGLHFGSSASLASDRIVYDRVTGSLWYDSDGSGAAKAVKFAILSNKPLLSADDFTIV